MRNGGDLTLGRYVPEPEEGETSDGRSVIRHAFWTVYREMLLEICSHYRCLPDPRTLRASEIRFFFEGMRPALRELTKPRK